MDAQGDQGPKGLILAIVGLILLVTPVLTLVVAIPGAPAVPEAVSLVVRIASVLIGANLLGAAWSRRRAILGMFRRG